MPRDGSAWWRYVGAGELSRSVPVPRRTAKKPFDKEKQKEDTRPFLPPGELVTNPPGALYKSALEPLWSWVSFPGDSPHRFGRCWRKAAEPQALLFAADLCVFEVCNGGFTQLFFNTTGILAPEAARAFVLLELPEVAQLVDAAVAMFGAPYPRKTVDRHPRLEALMEKHGEPFFDLDQRFWALVPYDSFPALADAYVARNLSRFFQLT